VRSCYAKAKAAVPSRIRDRAQLAETGGYDFVVYLPRDVREVPRDVRADRKLTDHQKQRLTSCLKQNSLVCIGHDPEFAIQVSLPSARSR
jgi:hypothetical protein